MSRVIKLKESDITNIVRRILNEETKKPKGGITKAAMKETMKRKMTTKQFHEVAKEYNLLGSLKSLVSGYKRMYNKSPKWAQSESITPEALQIKIDDWPNYPPETKAVGMWMLIVANIIFWYCYGAQVGWWPSDLRLKENINRTGASKSGIPIYTFNYKNDDKLWSGTMAQDLLDMGMNEAVDTMDNGYYAVNYNMIDVDMVSL